MRHVRTALLLGACVLGFSSTASAYCRKTTSPDLAGGCRTEGAPLYRPSACLAYRLDPRATVIPLQDLEAAVGQAFATWLAPSSICAPGISVVELPPAALVVGDRLGDEENLITVPSTWTHEGEAARLAWTTLTFNAQTGAISSSVLELNPNVTWSFRATPAPGAIDLVATVTHEVGHMLGIADSNVAETAMYPSYAPGSVGQRALADDDEQAICSIYPSRETRVAAFGPVATTACRLGPGDPNAPCQPEITHGCEAARGTHASGIGALVMCGAALLVVRRRRRGTVLSSMA